MFKLIMLVGFSILFVGCSGDSGSGDAGNGKVHKEDNSAHGSSCKTLVLPTTGEHLYYCVQDYYSAAMPKNYIYYFHGLGGKAGDMFEVLPELSWIRSKFSRDQLPVHISLSLGPAETIPLEISGNNPASLRDIIDYAIPKIEKEIPAYNGPGTTPFVPARHLLGISLGGFNALNVATLRPSYFKSIIALCPALIRFNPFDDNEVNAYIARTGAQKPYVDSMIGMIRTKFKNLSQWNERNPVQLMTESKFAGVPLFVSTGDQDEYGFQEGALAFYNASADWNVANSIFAPAKGPHCAFDANQLYEFLKINLN